MEIQSVPYVRIEDLFADFADLRERFSRSWVVENVVAAGDDSFFSIDVLEEWLGFRDSEDARIVLGRVEPVRHCLVRW